MFFFQAEDGIRVSVAFRGLGDVNKRQPLVVVIELSPSGGCHYSPSGGCHRVQPLWWLPFQPLWWLSSSSAPLVVAISAPLVVATEIHVSGGCHFSSSAAADE